MGKKWGDPPDWEGYTRAGLKQKLKQQVLIRQVQDEINCKNSVPQWGAESSLAGQWLPTASGDGAWSVRTGSGQMRMFYDIFAASQLRRGRLLMTGCLSARHPVVMGAGDVS
jgi:hypothetical protein